jgi:natural product biosynthesis luciferase-like monooxygenase protein
MNDLSQRMASLSPDQLKLLERRLEENGLHLRARPESSATVAAPAQKSVTRRLEDESAPIISERDKRQAATMNFSLFFFSDDGAKDSEDKYRLLIESVKFADQNGFSAVWTPERHFQDFGGLYPNPSVLSAALAMITSRIQIRAGSVALPLHNPVRVAEEWSVVDNLSKGRVGLSLASGWHPLDFVLSPDTYENRKQVMFQHIRTIQKLWAGEAVMLQGVGGSEVGVRILPRPLQKKLPMWLAISQNPETWIQAGEIGANVLTSIVKQPLEVLAKKIELYRDSLARHGHDPQAGEIVVMLHTFLGEDNNAVREIVRPSLCQYFRENIKQLGLQTDVLLRTQSQRATIEAEHISEDDLDSIASFAFERYFDTSLLCGTPHKCAGLIDRLLEIGVSEVACLIDFGLDVEQVLGSLRHLNELRGRYSNQTAHPRQNGNHARIQEA